MSETHGPTPRTDQIGPTGKPRRALRIALILSLMLNLLLIGVIGGGVMRFARFEPPHIPGQPDVRALWRALPEHAQRDLRAMARERGFPGEHGPRLSREERRARMDAANARILDLLRADQFDAEAFAVALLGERDALDRRMEAAREAFANEIANLTPSERAAMADRLEASWRTRSSR
ncbi:MAG: hypothetical protein Kow0013_11380 [Pararhodobacter sp.]